MFATSSRSRPDFDAQQNIAAFVAGGWHLTTFTAVDSTNKMVERHKDLPRNIVQS